MPQAVCCDVDGVLLREGQLLPGVASFLASLRESRLPLVLLTNHSEADPGALAALVTRLGYPLDPEQVLTSAGLAADYLKLQGIKRVRLLGGPKLQRRVEAAEIEVVTSDEPADAVLVGYLTQISISQLNSVTRHLLAGERFLGTNGDLRVPHAGGPALETGAWLSMLTSVTGREAEIIAKPTPFAFSRACQVLGKQAVDVVMIGDTLETDIVGGKQFGMVAWRVRSGNGPSASEVGIEADKDFAGVAEIADYLDHAAELPANGSN